MLTSLFAVYLYTPVRISVIESIAEAKGQNEKSLVYTVNSCYYDTAGIREIYHYIQTIDITSINLCCGVRVRIKILYRNKQYFAIINRHRNIERPLLCCMLRYYGFNEYTVWRHNEHMVYRQVLVNDIYIVWPNGSGIGPLIKDPDVLFPVHYA
jgi:hypothetical protein